MESILETKAATVVEFFAGLRGTLSVTFEEGTCAAWLYDLLKPRVDKLVVCNSRSKDALFNSIRTMIFIVNSHSTQMGSSLLLKKSA